MNDLTTTIIGALLSFIVNLFLFFIMIGKYKNKVDALELTVGKDEHQGLRKTVGDIRDKVVACETSLKEREPLTKRKSPVSLTDRGQSFLVDSGSKKFVDENFDELLKKIEISNPKTAYDVQENAKEVVRSLREDERLNPIKDFLFKDGSSMDDIIVVMGIYLRDQVLAHKKLNPNDIDLYEK